MTARRELLEEAAELVDGERNAQYGDPRQDFQRTADMWSAYLGVPVAPHDVAAMMVMLKCSRIRWSPGKRDSWVDVAGYAACGWDCARDDVVDPASYYLKPDPVLERLLDEEERISRSRTPRPPAP